MDLKSCTANLGAGLFSWRDDGQRARRQPGFPGLPFAILRVGAGSRRKNDTVVKGFGSAASTVRWPPGADPSGGLQPAPYARAVATIDIAEFALEIGFLAGHNAVADDEREGHQHHQEPEIVEPDGQAEQTREPAEVD